MGTKQGSSARKRLGVFGGTFNPIHVGHLIVAEDVREQFLLDKILFIPSGRPPHKRSAEMCSAEDRLEMTRLAIQSNPYFQVSNIELERPGKSFTLNTLKKLIDLYPSFGIFYILGLDAFADLESWHEPEQVLRQARFIVMTRPGSPNLDSIKFKNPVLNSLKQSQVELAEVIEVDISATMIRKRIRQGKSVRYLVPDVVAEYIATRKLYQLEE